MERGAGVLRLGVQPLEDDEDPVQILGLNADAIVAHREHPLLLGGVDRDVDRSATTLSKRQLVSVGSVGLPRAPTRE